MRKLSPVGWLPDGTPVWPVAGGDGEGSTGESGGESGSNGGAGSSGEGASNGNTQEGDDPGDDPAKLKEALAKAQARVHELSSENANRRVQGKTAAEQLAEAQAKLRSLEDKDKSELDIAKRTVAETQQENEKLKSELQKARIENAFFTHNKYTWQNPAHAMALADMSGVTIGDDGRVTGLDKALDALAKSHQYLLKQKDAGPQGGAGQPSGPPNAGRTPTPANTRNRTSQESRFPALRSRPPTQ